MSNPHQFGDTDFAQLGVARDSHVKRIMRIPGTGSIAGRPFLATAAVVATCLFGDAARADATASQDDAGERRFGIEILLADVASLGLVVGGGALGSKTDSAAVGYGLAVPGAIGFLAAGPTIHALHHDGGGALRSAAWRILAPLAGGAGGAALGYALDAGRYRGHDCSEGCASLGLGVFGFGVGVLTAMIVDWTTAREPSRRPQKAGTLVMPTVSIGPRGAGAGFIMQF